MNKLAILTDVERRLARVRTVDEAKSIRDQAEAIRVYAKSARRGLEIQNHAAYVKIQAERRAGELLAVVERANGGGHKRSTASLAAVLQGNEIAETTARRWQIMSKVPETRVQEIAAYATGASQELTSATIFREARAYVERKPMPVMSDGIYRIVYADPPWDYGGGCFVKEQIGGGAESHYPTMPLEDICSMRLPVVADDAVLFLWVPAPHLQNAFAVIKAWNFAYKTNMVWDKVRHNIGHYVSVRHEHFLIAVRGSCTPDSNKLPDSVQTIERGDVHSRKPEIFRQIIDTQYPIGPRIELFARGVLPAGWDGWGNEYQGRRT